MSLPDRLRDRWDRRGWTRSGDRVVVACSGGLDSVTLLHLLRFPLADLGLEVEAAHFDHAMRAGSRPDALWVRGLARAWGVSLHEGKARPPPGNEGEARRLRYAFLEGVRKERRARWILTAHHADDQVETLLFRIVRGTGVHGLRGIPTVRPPGILRPLLPFPREELEGYARARGLPRRDDPTNLSREYRRNRIRLDVLPLLEEVHPGAREAILRLGRNAARALGALEVLLAPVVEAVVVSQDDEGLEVDRDSFLAHPPSVQRALARRLVREMGPRLGEAGTALTLSFMRTGSSGGKLELPGGVTLSRNFDRLRFRRAEGEGRPAGEGSAPLVISGPDSGRGELRLGGRRFRVNWGAGPPGAEPGEGEPGGWQAAFDPGHLRFPLEVRGWRPGDRTRTTGGGKKLGKLFGELRVPAHARATLPLVVDGTGEVLWIPGRHRAPRAEAGSPEETWRIGVEDVEPT